MGHACNFVPKDKMLRLLYGTLEEYLDTEYNKCTLISKISHEQRHKLGEPPL